MIGRISVLINFMHIHFPEGALFLRSMLPPSFIIILQVIGGYVMEVISCSTVANEKIIITFGLTGSYEYY